MTEERSNTDVPAAKAGMKIIASSGDNKFVHLCFYESLEKNGDLKEGIDSLASIYGNLLGMHAFIAGFQYVVLDNDELDLSEGDTLVLTLFAVRYLGFFMSVIGVLVCIAIHEYLMTIKNEDIETIVKGGLRYAYFIQSADYLAILSIGLISVSCTLLPWQYNGPLAFNIALNAVIAIAMLIFLRSFYLIIHKSQPGRVLYKDADYIEARKRLQQRSIMEKLRDALKLNY